ncbi:MAG: DUF951 domain-containing protein [Clostridia bacterium]
MEVNIGDVLRLKKPHPCGGYCWEVLRVGADFRLKCQTCGHVVMLARSEVMRRVKEIIPKEENTEK